MPEHPTHAPTQAGEGSPDPGSADDRDSVTFQATSDTASPLPPPPPERVPTLGEHTLATGRASQAPMPAVPGYEVVSVLGRGGMGVVYKARHVKLQRLVALKMILAGGHASPSQLARFRTEAEAAARLQHPNVVQIHEVGEHDGLPYLALEFIEGGSLADKLDGTPWQSRPAARLMETVARALNTAHQRGIVHRDLKPANVLLTTDGVPKITDFGLAKKLDDMAGPTGTGELMGTPSYMAPEQTGLCPQPIGPATDVYALGAILYELLTGRPPFKGATVLDTVYQVVHQEPVPPRHLQPKVPRDLETVCLKCLQKEPKKRYASAEALAEDLHRFLQDLPIQARPASTPERLGRWCRRNPKVASLLTVLALVLVAATATVTSLWLLAEERRRTAENNLVLAERRRKEARANYRKARDAVDQLAKIGSEWLRDVPHQEKLRQALLEEALRLNQEFLQENSDDPEIRQETARTYAHLGAIYELLGKPKEAEKLFRQSLELRVRLLEEFPDDPEHRQDLAYAYESLGFFLKHTKPREAEQAFRRGLVLAEEVVARSRGVPEYQDGLASIHNNLGNLLSRNRPREAEEAYRQALEIWQELATADPDAPKYQSKLGWTYSNLGKILMDRGQTSRSLLGVSTVGLIASTSAQGPMLAACALVPERVEELPLARQLTNQAIDHQQRALKRYPRNGTYRTDLAIHYDQLGAILKRLGEDGEAEKAMLQCQAVRQELADDFPATPHHQRDLGGVLNNLALIQLLQGKLAEARSSIEEAIVHQQAARKMNREDPMSRAYLRHHYWNLANILVFQEEHGKAVRAAAEMSAVFPDRSLDHLDAAWFVARCIPLAETDVRLPEDKRKELVQTYADQAMRYLQDGAAKGPMDAASIQRRPAFEPLRSRADYKELMAELEAKEKPAPR